MSEPTTTCVFKLISARMGDRYFQHRFENDVIPPIILTFWRRRKRRRGKTTRIGCSVLAMRSQVTKFTYSRGKTEILFNCEKSKTQQCSRVTFHSSKIPISLPTTAI